jgi:hypothetical protein
LMGSKARHKTFTALRRAAVFLTPPTGRGAAFDFLAAPPLAAGAALLAFFGGMC